MATIETRQTPDGKTSYRVKIRIRGFPSQSATFERKTDARQWAQQTETAMREGRYFKTTQAKKYTVSDLIKRYLDYQKTRNPKRADSVVLYLDWWKNEIGAYSLADVTKNLIIEKRDKLISTGKNVEKRATSTANRYMGALSHAFSVAVNEWEWLQEHPMGKIAKLPESRGRVRFLSEDERKRLLAACTAINSEFIYSLVVLALSTGARHGELINLQWKDVDFKRKAIVLHDTKNSERRVLPLAHHALELMQAQYEGRNKVSPLVFPSPQQPMRPWESRAAWLTALEKAKIEDFRFHDLRHTAASYLAMNGASTNEIAEVLGHKTLAMVKRYSHLSEVHTAGVVEKMNKKIFPGDGMTEEILIDADSMTLERVERYLSQRRERGEQGRKSTQDWFLEMLVKLMSSLDDEEASQIDSEPDNMRQALRLVADKLDQLDKKISPPKERLPRAEQFAKERCQAVAKYLWNLYPDMTQPEMAAHEAIFNLKITGSKGYTLETVKKWIAEVDPRAPEKKIGRPRKAKK